MLTTFFEGLFLVLQWPTIGFLILGVFLGVWLGAVPGLSGIIGIVIVLPFTYGMDPVAALAILLAIYAVTATGDTLSAVLLGVPGTAAAAATVLDGYPLAQQGQAERAFGAAFTVSMMGGVIGGLILALSLPFIRPVITQFASPELLMLGLLGLTMVGSLSGASVLKGLSAAGLGLLFSTVGYPPASPVPRYWFNQIFLLEGLPLIAVVLGLFAIPEVMSLALRNRAISAVPRNQSEGGGTRQGIRDALRHWFLVVRCSAIGIYIGMLPGLGASIVDWVAYGHTVQSSKAPSNFGRGDIRGVIGPEAANNAVRGGALIPTVAFGIPGSASMAILLGALLIQGIRPGEQMLGEKLVITYSMVWSIILANILAAIVLLFAARQIARIAFVPGHFIVPGVMALVLMGCWLERAHLGVWGVLILVGFLGVWMRLAGWPRAPFLLGFILGPIMESGYRLSTQAYGQTEWLTRPWVMAISALIVLTLALKLLSRFRGLLRDHRRAGAGGGDVRAARIPKMVGGEGEAGNPLLSILLTLTLIGVFAWAWYTAQGYRPAARLFPGSVAVLSLGLLAMLLVAELLPWLTRWIGRPGVGPAPVGPFPLGSVLGSLVFLIAISATAMAATVLGHALALSVFAMAYLALYARVGVIVAAIYAAGVYGFVTLFYGQLLAISLMRPQAAWWPL